MDKLKMHSPDLTQRNIDAIADLFPAVVTETLDADGNPLRTIDFDALRQELTDHVVEGPRERYQLDWPGKRAAAFAANAPIAKTLRPVRDESVDFDTTRNLFIEGDNLDALKLLQESYLGKVKLIFIDPPYNTGHDFVYDDDFAESSADYLERSGQWSDVGERLVANAESNGRFHSDWLSMMYPRLKLARNLLAEDGAIFISIDDNEAANLRRLCDEVFGEQNFVANVVWRSKDNSNNDAKRFSLDHNHILVYARSAAWIPERISDQSKQGHFRNPDSDPRGPYFDGNPLNSPNYRENLVYTLTSPQGIAIAPPKNGWRWSREAMQEKIASGEIRFTPDGTGIRRRTYLADMKGLPPSTLWIDLDRTGHNRQAKYELLKLMPEDVFDTPKPVRLIRFILELAAADRDSVVLDFFAGSASTADAVMQQNAADGGSRRYIMVQLPEPCAPDSEAAKAGFASIADIAKERLRRSGAQIAAGLGLEAAGFDRGFRVLRVDTTNMAPVLHAPDQTAQPALADLANSVKPDRTPQDLVFQVLLDWALDMSEPVVTEEVYEREILSVADGALVACFADDITSAVVKEIASRHPLRAVFLDAGFASDAARINAEQIFREVSPETEVRAI
ncbi:site-specific DNA-methyltransferase [Nostocoides sp. HKS02]|uniref:site-specific DNA-methyltransferase n=1 Tax=Nostocoides sp. HKS02 TaxID=1813880 RepID=UPI0012B47693|nr:site-specific DNA-methyltransferase [Tetrasphaera sp. HKS02]QGN58088.1 site-specific DNA-methyltransferase [Tetrasphaera sp. HKS02]